MANGPSDTDSGQGRAHSGGGWTPIPDPTRLTTEQLRATEAVLNQNIFTAVAGLRELVETRLTAMDKATELLATDVRQVPSDLDKGIATLKALLEQRLDAMDKADSLVAVAVDRAFAEVQSVRERIRDEFAAADTSLRELLGARIDAMDTAARVLADSYEKVPSDIDRAAASLKEVLAGDIQRVSAVTLEKFNAVDALFASNATALTAALAAQEKAVAEQNKSNTLAIDKSEQATKETIAANANQTSTGLAGLSTVMDDLKARVVRLEASIQNTRVASEDTLAVGTFRQTSEANRANQSRQTFQLAIAALSAIVAVIAVLFAVLHK